MYDEHTMDDHGERERRTREYFPPEDVTAPADALEVDQVVFDGGAGGPSYATIYWWGRQRLGQRYKGYVDRPLGMPLSSSKPVFFVTPEDQHDVLIPYLVAKAPEHAAYIREFFSTPPRETA
jgi:hypothetical protein